MTFIVLTEGEMADLEVPAKLGLADAVVHAVTSHIRDGGLRAGDLLPSEGDLALELGISRAAVREGFRSLSALKMIDVGNGRRAKVARPDGSVLATILDHAVVTDEISVQQIFDVRRTIEARTAALAAFHSSKREAGAIAALAAAMRSDFASPDRVMAHDIAFHEAIAQASHNPAFALIVSAFHSVTRQTWPIGWKSRPNDQARWAMIEGHEAIVAAIVGRDPDAAETAMTRHFDQSVQALIGAGVH